MVFMVSRSKVSRFRIWEQFCQFDGKFMGKTSTAPFKSNTLSSTDASGGRFADDSALGAASETRQCALISY